MTAARTFTWRPKPATHQPDWPDSWELTRARQQLASAPPLTSPKDIRELKRALAEVAAGKAYVLQGGDCAEPFGRAARRSARAKDAILSALSNQISDTLDVPVVVIGRLAGQFAKPRSEPTEVVDGRTMPTFRGLAVNSPEPVAAQRVPDVRRMITAYRTARAVLAELHNGMWVSHEALLLDYEEPLVRTDGSTRYLASTHFPWIGERTRDVDGAHVELLSNITNPVGCKIGPSATPEEVVALCARLDPDREPGRLTLISRLGTHEVRTLLPPLVRAVQAEGHPVVWMCDPMHANTRITGTGLKTRHLQDVTGEAVAFHETLRELDQWPGGLHLELAGEDVTECVGGEQVPDETALVHRYTSLCDPRLNNEQASAVVDRLGRLDDDLAHRGLGGG